MQYNSKNTLSVCYTIAVLEGKFKDRKVFPQLVDAMVNVQDHEERGVGLQNFPHPPEYE